MLLVLSTAAALVIWIILWAIGAKGFDAFMVSILIVLLAATTSLLMRSLPGNRKSADEPADPAPFN
jgi:uncharacterized membrane protein